MSSPSYTPTNKYIRATLSIYILYYFLILFLLMWLWNPKVILVNIIVLVNILNTLKYLLAIFIYSPEHYMFIFLAIGRSLFNFCRYLSTLNIVIAMFQSTQVHKHVCTYVHEVHKCSLRVSNGWQRLEGKMENKH